MPAVQRWRRDADHGLNVTSATESLLLTRDRLVDFSHPFFHHLRGPSATGAPVDGYRHGSVFVYTPTETAHVLHARAVQSQLGLSCEVTDDHTKHPPTHAPPRLYLVGVSDSQLSHAIEYSYRCLRARRVSLEAGPSTTLPLYPVWTQTHPAPSEGSETVPEILLLSVYKGSVQSDGLLRTADDLGGVDYASHPDYAGPFLTQQEIDATYTLWHQYTLGLWAFHLYVRSTIPWQSVQ